MFHVYEPDDYYLCEYFINSFVTDLPEELLLSLSDLQQATFILLSEKAMPTKGGALLIKKKIGSLHSTLSKALQSHFPLLQDVWTGSVCLQLPSHMRGRDFEFMCKAFYRMIYEDLIAFGIKERTPFICLTMTPTEHLSTEIMGFWPYVLGVKADESSDGLFHGILALKGSKLETQWFWKDPDLLSQQIRMGRGGGSQMYSGDSAEKKGGMLHG